MTQRDCDDCHYCELEPAEEPCKSCNATDEGFTNWKKREHPPMTNADRIRDMSDKELARFLASVENRRSADGGGAQWCGMAHALKWIQQPAEEVTHD